MNIKVIKKLIPEEICEDGGASVIIVAGSRSRMLPMQLADFWVQDCSAATENILLRAVELGLGTVWCGVYPQKTAVKKVSEILGLPSKHIPLNIIYVGHGAEEPVARDQFTEKCISYLR